MRGCAFGILRSDKMSEMPEGRQLIHGGGDDEVHSCMGTYKVLGYVKGN